MHTYAIKDNYGMVTGTFSSMNEEDLYLTISTSKFIKSLEGTYLNVEKLPYKFTIVKVNKRRNK